MITPRQPRDVAQTTADKTVVRSELTFGPAFILLDGPRMEAGWLNSLGRFLLKALERQNRKAEAETLYPC